MSLTETNFTIQVNVFPSMCILLTLFKHVEYFKIFSPIEIYTYAGNKVYVTDIHVYRYLEI